MLQTDYDYGVLHRSADVYIWYTHAGPWAETKAPQGREGTAPAAYLRPRNNRNRALTDSSLLTTIAILLQQPHVHVQAYRILLHNASQSATAPQDITLTSGRHFHCNPTMKPTGNLDER